MPALTSTRATLARTATIGLIVGLAAAGCGRKAPLDRPGTDEASQPRVIAGQSTTVEAGVETGVAADANDTIGQTTTPAPAPAAPARDRRFFLDSLID